MILMIGLSILKIGELIKMKKTTNQLINEFMKNLEETAQYNKDELSIIYDNLNDIVRSAQEKVIADAEDKIASLRIFTLGR